MTLQQTQDEPQLQDFIVVPREKCESCHHFSGPKIYLTKLRDSSSLHRDNVVLENHNHVVIKSNIVYAQSEIGKLDAEIALLQQSTRALKNRRRQLQEFECSERALTSPIRALPVDVLREIFQIALQDYIDNFTEIDLRLAFPHIASQVSHHWRSVAQSFPQLWTDICIFVRSDSTLAEKSFVATYVNKCISFSKDLPLCVWLLQGCTRKLLRGCLTMLAKHAGRWERFTVWNDELRNEILYSILPSLGTVTELSCLKTMGLNDVRQPICIMRAPKLHQLKLTNTTNKYTYEYYYAGSVVFVDAPSLVSVMLQEVRNSSAMLPGFAWSQITHFTSNRCEYSDPEDFYNILRGIPNLTHLEYEGTIESRQPPSAPLTIPYLEELTVEYCNEYLLGHLTAPSLKTLIMKGWCNPTVVVDFLRRQKCTLKNLGLYNQIIIDADWRIPELQELTKLELSNRDPLIIPGDFKWLEIDHSNIEMTVFPKLETLVIQKINFETKKNAAAFISILKSRLRPVQMEPGVEASSIENAEDVRYLKIIQINCECHLLKALKGCIASQDIRASGVDITVDYYRK